MARIQTTHVGSLVRPDELIAFLRQFDKKDPAYDEAAHMECLARSVQGVVAKQKEVGVDIVSDGEYGKVGVELHVYERLGGIELRLQPAPARSNFASVNERPTDWGRFHEFYAEYFAKEQDYESPGGDWACVGEVTYTGGDAINRDIANLKAAMAANGVTEGFLPGRRAGELLPDPRRALRLREAALMGASPRRCARSTRAIVDAGSVRADRRRVHPVHVRRTSCLRGTIGGLQGVGAAAHRRAEPRARGHPPGPRPLPRLLGHLARPAHGRHRRWRTSSTSCFQVKAEAYLFENANPRHEHEWRVWEDTKLPDGQDPRARRHQPRDERRRAPRARRGADRAHRRLVGPENVIASTDCGFAQGPYLQRVQRVDPVGEARLPGAGSQARVGRPGGGLSAMRAAVFVEQDAPFVVEDVQLHPCADDEVVVRTGGAAFCITDCHMQHGHLPVVPPAILGHSAVGVVEQAGAHVERVRVGERVIVPATPECGRCYFCLRHRSDQCVRLVGAPPRFVGTRADGTEVRAGGTATYAEQIKIPEVFAFGVDSDLPDEQLALMGCGVVSGLGAVHARGRGAAGLVRGRRRLRASRALDDPGGARRRRGAGHRRRAAARTAGARRRARSDGPRRPRRRRRDRAGAGAHRRAWRRLRARGRGPHRRHGAGVPHGAQRRDRRLHRRGDDGVDDHVPRGDARAARPDRAQLPERQHVDEPGHPALRADDRAGPRGSAAGDQPDVHARRDQRRRARLRAAA